VIAMAKILIVEEDKPINALIKKNLELIRHSCIQIYDSDMVYGAIENSKFDIILLEIMLPGGGWL